MNKTYCFRIYPNIEQTTLILKTFGCCRFVFNFYLENRIVVYKMSGETYNYYDCANNLKLLKRKYPWLKEVDSTALQSVVKNLDNAYKNFFRDKSVGYPKYKSKHNHRNSYTTKMANNNIKIVDNKHIQLPKLGLVRCKFSRKVEGRILNVTVEQSPSGRFYVAICCTDVDIKPLPRTKASVGIDLGIENMATDSNGKIYPNHKYLSQLEKSLKHEQRVLSRKQHGSHRWNKQRIKVAKIQEKISDCRKDYINKFTTNLVRGNDIICIEDLNTKGMVRNHHLSKSIHDVSFGEIKRQLKYKTEWYGKTLVEVGRTYPSSQICSQCGYQDNSMRNLKKRKFKCPNCGYEATRDENASINIKNEGLRIYKEQIAQ